MTCEKKQEAKEMCKKAGESSEVVGCRENCTEEKDRRKNWRQHGHNGWSFSLGVSRMDRIRSGSPAEGQPAAWRPD